ncbi:MAG: hypothetical protein HXX18_14130 [Bacteroidetes bacterium]|nr:hypothetical protein [Bacteroidota bacterium]
MFHFRINRIKISDTKEYNSSLIFEPKSSVIKFINFITTENSLLPDMSYFLKTTDISQKKIVLRQVIKKVISTRIYKEINPMADDHTLLFGTPGYVLYKSNQVPNNFEWQFIACENDQDMGDEGQMLENIVNDSNFTNFTNYLAGSIGKTDNPSHSAAVSIARYALNVTSRIAQQNHNALLGISYTSLNRRQHYIYGGRKKERISDLTNNVFVDYSIFGYDE